MKLDTLKNKENNLEHTVNWETKSIKSLCLKVTSGGTPSRKNPAFYEEGTIPWLKTKELKDWYIDDSEEKITLEALNNSSAKIFPQNTVLMAMYGDGKTITSLGILRIEAATNQACCALITNPEVCDYLFLFYSLKFHRQDFISMASGGSQRNLNGQLIRNFTIKAPPLETQRKITYVLSKYDHLIENNTRRIEILEQMAKLVYEEWFVKFRFSGHEKVKMVSSELGEIPEGWKVKEVSEILKRLKAGKKYTQDNVLEEGLIPVIDQSEKEVLGFHNNAADHTASLKDPIMIFGDHTCKIKILIEPFSIGPNVVPFISTSYPETFVFFLIKNLVQTKEYKRHWNELQAKKIVLPDVDLVKNFVSLVNPLFQQITLFEHKNQNLRKTRDLLLPKLISGEIDFSDLDIRIRNEYPESNFNFGEPQDEKGLRFKMV